MDLTDNPLIHKNAISKKAVDIKNQKKQIFLHRKQAKIREAIHGKMIKSKIRQQYGDLESRNPEQS